MIFWQQIIFKFNQDISMPSPKTNHSMINLNDEYILIKGEKWYKYIRIQSRKKISSNCIR